MNHSKNPYIPNVLAERYISSQMKHIFSPEGKILLERELWITVMKTQAELGIHIPLKAISSYEKAKKKIDLEWINNREHEIRHDLKAKLEAFNKEAGYEYAHLGMTSRDLSDNVEQMQIKKALLLLRDHTVTVLSKLSSLALQYDTLVYPERTHLMVAQPSVIGKIFSNFGEEMLLAFNHLENVILNYPLRGIKGAVGTQTDQLQLFNGDTKKVEILENKIVEYLGFKNVLNSIGQIYPRSLDFEVIALLFQLISGPANLALTGRILTGFEEFSEGFKKGQIGSSAMPHKMNSRNSERIFSFKNILMGYVVMAAGISGNQIFAGDVSDSATRRVALPDAFFATDAIIETILTILNECNFYPAIIQKNIDKYLPFLTTTRILMIAVKEGVGREVAHEVIKEHATALALDMKKTGTNKNTLLESLSRDKRLNIPKEKLNAAITRPIEYVGNAPKQIAKFAAKVEIIAKKYPIALDYMPNEII